MLHVRPAGLADMQTILGFIDEASAWLPMKNTDQWAKPWPNRELRDHRVRRGLEAHRTWIVEDCGVPVATISCRPDANPELWTEPGELGEPAVYVSRLIVKRSHAGRDIGTELLDWAGWWAAVQYQAVWIRIDVWTTNSALQNYYEKRGFERLRYCMQVDYPSACIMQKPTEGIEPSDFRQFTERPWLLLPPQTRRERTRSKAREYVRLTDGDLTDAGICATFMEHRLRSAAFGDRRPRWSRSRSGRG